MQKLFVTFFYVGFLKPASGTWGSLAGLISGYFIYQLSQETLFLSSILLFLISIKIIDAYEKNIGLHDASHIVIDEVAGIWIALSFTNANLISCILAFVFFRILDITKPSFIGRIDKKVKGGLGVMGDDMLAGIVAGIMTNLCWNLINHFYI